MEMKTENKLCNSIEPLSLQESYSERRKLFRDIWETAMSMNEKDKYFLQKPKVIKTLKLDVVDQSAGKRKKQRINNLRTVCKRLLEFCERQEADDKFYQKQINSDAWKTRDQNVQEPKQKKRHISKSTKKTKVKRKSDPSLPSTNKAQTPKPVAKERKFKPIKEETDNKDGIPANLPKVSKTNVTTHGTKVTVLKISKTCILEKPHGVTIMLNKATELVT